MKIPEFSVITPTFNRSSTLSRVYDGLVAQVFSNFEWIIVDDGSTDDTFDLVSRWTAPFPIKYLFEENRGKPSAVNLGIQNSRGKYIVILDSDDEPLPEALDIFKRYLDNSDDDVCSVGALIFNDAKVLGIQFQTSQVKCSVVEAFNRNGRLSGDNWFAHKADWIKRYPFPRFDSETFAPEGIVYRRMALNGGKVLFINIPLMIANYQLDGYSSNIIRIKFNNPIGFLANQFENITHDAVIPNKEYLHETAEIVRMIIFKARRPFVVAMLLLLSLPIGVLKGAFDRHRISKAALL